MSIYELINKLNRYTKAYDEGHPLISDKEWDDLYFELKQKEEKTGIIYPNSPTQKINYEIVSQLNKVEHNHPMLSLDKTKNIEEIKSFLGDHEWIAMAKMDGLTCSLRYLNGKLVSAETRGNGIEGEDITHNALVIPSIPNVIDYKDELIVDGEIICTYHDFELFKNTYKNPRNFASGSIRLLDSKECAKRKLTFIAWDVITSFNTKGLLSKYLSCKLDFIEELGFDVVLFQTKEKDELNFIIDLFKGYSTIYPIDGIVFKYDNIEEYNAAGRTDHHFKGGLAYKFYDETYPTRLKYIQWTMGRTGILTPVAVFDPIDIDGSTVERASLYNLSILKEKLGQHPYEGQKLWICKKNQIIPYVEKAEKISE